MKEYSTLIIGLGVSGLAVASVLTDDFVVIELGKKLDERNQFDPTECMMGAGGAGLFSDGKFSFWPAGTKIWNLEPYLLEKSYSILESYLKPFLGDKFPPYPVNSHTVLNLNSNNWIFKNYPSFYLGLADRKELIGRMISDIKGDILFEHKVLNFFKSNDKYFVHILDLKNRMSRIICVKNIIIGGGRFYPLYLDGIVPMIFRRIEYGARIVAPSENLDMIQTGITDPKYILTNDRYQARTFCWCKKGETILTDNGDGIRTYSGRADVDSTSSDKLIDIESNFGLNIRITEEPSDWKLWLDKILSMGSFELNAQNITRQNINKVYGEKLGSYFMEVYDKLIDKFPNLSTATIRGPSVEGIGFYPNIDEQTLKIPSENIYCIGDSSGIFRGIIASMLSGYHVGLQLNKLR